MRRTFTMWVSALTATSAKTAPQECEERSCVSCGRGGGCGFDGRVAVAGDEACDGSDFCGSDLRKSLPSLVWISSAMAP